MSKKIKLTDEEIATEEKRTTSIGLYLQAESFLKAANFIAEASHQGKLKTAFNNPTAFLISHGIELALKAWLRCNGKTLAELRATGHDLSKALKLCSECPLPLDEDAIFLEWTRQKPEKHLLNGAVVSEEDRVLTINKSIRRIGLFRQFILLKILHGTPYVFRYHRSDHYEYPNLELVAFFGIKLCEAIRPICLKHYNEFQKEL